jgi:ethanolamine utilization protein EutQ (cupin superfamily)
MSFDPKGYLVTPDDGPQLWFLDTLLEGELSLDCGDKHFTAGPGDFMFLPRGCYRHVYLATDR